MGAALDIAVVGCGSAGPAAALYLHRSGHRVRLFERAPELLPVGAGFLLQPTGLDVLGELGVLPQLVAHGAPVPALRCETRRGRRLLDLHYEELGAGVSGLGMHRAVLLHFLVDALAAAGIPVQLGCEVVRIEQANGRATLIEAGGARHGPFDLIVVADGARSTLRDGLAPQLSTRRYPWGALWHIAPDREGAFAGRLYQVVRGTRSMIGFLPTGRTVGGDVPLVSIFFSVELAAVDALRARGLAAWKEHVVREVPAAEPLLGEIGSFDDLTVAAYMDVRMRPWHRGAVVFIGDSAHATSPQLGQGVNLALLDARALATALADSGDVAAALQSFAASRRHQVRYYQWASRWLTPFFQSGWRPLGWVRDLGFPAVHWLGPLRRKMTRTMAGVERGIVRRSLPMPRPALPELSRSPSGS